MDFPYRILNLNFQQPIWYNIYKITTYTNKYKDDIDHTNSSKLLSTYLKYIFKIIEKEGVGK